MSAVAVDTERPLCSCHGEPQVLDGRGGWRCRVTDRGRKRSGQHRSRGDVTVRSTSDGDVVVLDDWRQAFAWAARLWMKSSPHEQAALVAAWGGEGEF